MMTNQGIKNSRILMVDDENVLRDRHLEDLETAGFVCFTACGRDAALEVIAAEYLG